MIMDTSLTFKERGHIDEFWERREIQLDDYCGWVSDLRITFEMENTTYGEYFRWFIDDVQIIAEPK